MTLHNEIFEFTSRHTHELIDQIFSRIAVALARMLAMTFSDLAKIITYSYEPNHKVMKLTRTINIHAWLQGTSERPVLQPHWSGITEANGFLLRRALVSTTELKYQRGLQSRLRNQVNPHGVQGWCRYVISLLKDLCTTLLDQSFHDGKETRKISRRATELQTRRRLKTLKIQRK